ncbi:Sucrase/ferredoxin-like protein [Corchorus olitorius]|uniref:Sucrase/ferredoxin-like protein n=1 Tax=Corchorus olitorius TaxID=93759 RepID=A0A1R3K918_9ROSI|nr:Sucrase/ferredoxin-like protein [Corchorus olitorius]
MANRNCALRMALVAIFFQLNLVAEPFGNVRKLIQEASCGLQLSDIQCAVTPAEIDDSKCCNPIASSRVSDQHCCKGVCGRCCFSNDSPCDLDAILLMQDPPQQLASKSQDDQCGPSAPAGFSFLLNPFLFFLCVD